MRSARQTTSCPRRRGVAIVYGVVAITVLMGLCVLAVDFGRAQLVQSELQACADGAARAAASGLSTSVAEAKTRARELGAMNRAGGAAITFTDADFRFGKWNAGTNQIDTSGVPIDAVEITARRNVSLLFGGMIGKDATDIAAHATARAGAGAASTGFVGLNGVEFMNGGFIGSYKSSVTTTPSPASSTGKGIIASNVVVDVMNGAHVSGDVVLGPSGNLLKNNSFTLTGSVIQRPAPFTPPADPPWTPAANPAGVPQNYTVNSNTTLPGGTYWFTSLRVIKRLTFSGPATVYVNGNVYTDDSIVTYQSKPSNLKIYVLGNDRLIALNESEIRLYAEIQAPGAALEGNNKMFLYGSGVFRSILSKNSCEFYVDEKAGSGGNAGGIALVQ